MAETKSAVIMAYKNIPYSVFATEIEGIKKQNFIAETNEIMEYYTMYEEGVEFSVEGSNGHYTPSKVRYKKVFDLINKEARFLFSIPPTITVNPNRSGMGEEEKANNSKLNEFIGKVLKDNSFNTNLSKAAKDCFIGKRIACMLNFNDKEGITISFLNSTEFLYEYTGVQLSKIVAIIILSESTNKAEQIVKKKIYEMGEDGFCYVEETLYDGTGKELEEGKLERTKTKFQRIPACVIINDGLINDSKGVSDVNAISEYEATYSKLSNSDIDAGRKCMNPIRYAIDASTESTENLSSAPGSFWDIQSDQNGSDPKNASVGMLEASMNYSGALKVTLDRVENSMYSQLEIPNINSEKLQGVITSGKTLKALYWGLIVRCNEKMLTWGPAIEYIIEVVLEGAQLYPESVRKHYTESINFTSLEVLVENNYPLPEDEAEEKAVDLSEVTSQTMSRKSYMKKWRNLTDEEVDEELKQMALERQLLEDSYSMTPEGARSDEVI